MKYSFPLIRTLLNNSIQHFPFSTANQLADVKNKTSMNSGENCNCVSGKFRNNPLYVLRVATTLKHARTHCLEHNRQEPISDYWKLIRKWPIYRFTLHLSAPLASHTIGNGPKFRQPKTLSGIKSWIHYTLCQLIYTTMPELYEFFLNSQWWNDFATYFDVRTFYKPDNWRLAHSVCHRRIVRNELIRMWDSAIVA